MHALVVALTLVAAVSGFQDIQRGYHEAVGIPEAARIKAAEDQILARSRDGFFDRIVGGAVAPVNAHPYLVSVFNSLLH